MRDRRRAAQPEVNSINFEKLMDAVAAEADIDFVADPHWPVSWEPSPRNTSNAHSMRQNAIGRAETGMQKTPARKHTHTHTHTHACTHACTRSHTHTHIHTYAHVHRHMHTHKHKHTHTHTYPYNHKHTYTHAHACTRLHTHAQRTFTTHPRAQMHTYSIHVHAQYLTPCNLFITAGCAQVFSALLLRCTRRLPSGKFCSNRLSPRMLTKYDKFF